MNVVRVVVFALGAALALDTLRLAIRAFIIPPRGAHNWLPHRPRSAPRGVGGGGVRAE